MTSSAIKNALRAATTIRPVHYADGGEVAPTTDYSKPDDLGLYSHGAVLASKMPMAKGNPEQIKGYLTKQGVKPDEFKWSGYDEKLGGKPSVTREEVARHFHENKPAIKEHVLDRNPNHYSSNGQPTKFPTYTLPGGKNYRENLLQLELPKKKWPDDQLPENKGYRSSHWDQPNVLAHLRLSDRDLPNKQKALHLEELQSDWAQEGRSKGFQKRYSMPDLSEDHIPNSEKDTHWFVRSPDNVFRIAKAKYPNLEDAKKYIIDTKTSNPGGTPHGPYVDSTSKWLDLGLKRALYEAAKGGHDKLVVTPGEEQAKRYDLSKQINSAKYFPEQKMFQATLHSGRKGIVEENIEPEHLPGLIGKEVADRLLAQPLATSDIHKTPHHAISGLDLKVGGEGMKAFYDKMLPQALQKLAKRHDPAAEVKLHGHKLYKGRRIAAIDREMDALHEQGDINTDPRLRAAYQQLLAERNKAFGQPQTGLHSLDITPKMRASILKGSPHFESGGMVKAEQQPIDGQAKSAHRKHATKLVAQALRIAGAKGAHQNV